MTENHSNENTRGTACSLLCVTSEPFGYPAFYVAWDGSTVLKIRTGSSNSLFVMCWF